MKKYIDKLKNINKRTKIIIISIILILLGILIYNTILDNKAINFVKNSNFEIMPNITVEEYFNKKFDGCKYKSYKEDNVRMVEFNGKGPDLEGDYSNIKIVFSINSEKTNWTLVKIVIDGMPLSSTQRGIYMWQIYSLGEN